MLQLIVDFFKGIYRFFANIFSCAKSPEPTPATTPPAPTLDSTAGTLLALTTEDAMRILEKSPAAELAQTEAAHQVQQQRLIADAKQKQDKERATTDAVNDHLRQLIMIAENINDGYSPKVSHQLDEHISGLNTEIKSGIKKSVENIVQQRMNDISSDMQAMINLATATPQYQQKVAHIKKAWVVHARDAMTELSLHEKSFMYRFDQLRESCPLTSIESFIDKMIKTYLSCKHLLGMKVFREDLRKNNMRAESVQAEELKSQDEREARFNAMAGKNLTFLSLH